MTFLTYSGPQYKTRAKVLLDSIQKYHPKAQIIHKDLEVSLDVGSYIPGFHNRKYHDILELLDQGHDQVVFIGSDCELFSPLYEVENSMHDILLTPHIKCPVQDREHMLQLYRTGHINSDFLAFSNSDTSKKALKWLTQVVDDQTTEGAFYDQTWISSLPFLFPGVHILRHSGYNVGYWDFIGTKIDNRDNTRASLSQLRFFHYSGYKKGICPKMSVHSTELASEEVLKLFEEYDKKI